MTGNIMFLQCTEVVISMSRLTNSVEVSTFLWVLVAV